MRRSGRKRAKIDYVALNEASFRQKGVHHHWDSFMDFAPLPIDQDLPACVIQIDKPEKPFTDADLSQLVRETQLSRPILVSKANPNVEGHCENVKLSFQFPKLDIDQLCTLVGPDRMVPVMNSMTQEILPHWDFSKWSRYFKDKDHRDKVLNVISMEFSESQLGTQVEIPKVVKEMDIVTSLFDRKQLADVLNEHSIESPRVQKYILMSTANCLTDFHIDFAATSVYYSPIQGSKRFIMFPPLKRNLDIYKRWCLSTNQNDQWLPDLIPALKPSEIRSIREDDKIPNSYINNGLVVDVAEGDLLLLPSGWIHAVITLADSLVFGGNFLNLASLQSHLNAYQLEIDTKVPEKFKFPQFVTFLWLFAFSLLSYDSMGASDARSCLSLVSFLQDQVQFLSHPPKCRSQREKKEQHTLARALSHSIPREIIQKDPGQFLTEVQRHLDGFVC